MINAYFDDKIEDIDYSKPLSAFSVDSFAFLNLRLDLEARLGGEIPDKNWTEMKTIGDLIHVVQTTEIQTIKAPPPQSTLPFGGPTNMPLSDNSVIFRTTRHVSIDMPQMALGGLSESWFAKEMGDIHWEMIGKGLKQKSKDMVDAKGRRLYATFTRLKYSFSRPISSIEECDTGTIYGTLSLFGSSLCFSEIHGKIGSVDFTCKAMTTFSAREVEHKNDLLKSSPANGFDPRILRQPFYPQFAQEYKNVFGLGDTDGELVFMGANHPLSFSKALYKKTSHPIDPFMHINGANLLYFAAYHHINDIFEREAILEKDKIDISTQRGVVHRDIFYFSNAELEHELSYQLANHLTLRDTTHITVSRLKNEQSGKIMAVIITGRSDV